MSNSVRIVEVGPRDGLQNEKTPVSVADRIVFIEALLAAGLPTIEVGAFVSPKAIPQMANSDQVLREVSGLAGGEFHVLVPNEKGYEAARAAGAKVIAVFAAASESFSRANINCSVANRSNVSSRWSLAPRPMGSRYAATFPACSAVPMRAR